MSSSKAKSSFFIFILTAVLKSIFVKSISCIVINTVILLSVPRVNLGQISDNGKLRSQHLSVPL